MSSATRNCCRLGARSVHTCTSLQCHFIGSDIRIRSVYACLAITCHRNFWQNERVLLYATAVTRGWNRYRNKSQQRKLALEKKFLLPLLWYETDAVVSLCAVTKLCFDCLRFGLLLWRWGWPVNDWNVSSCLLYTCETAYYNMVAAVKREHHLPGQYSLPAHWTAQTRRPSFSTRGWAGESFRQWISGKATFDCSSSSQVWVCKHLTLAKVVHHLRLSRRNRPAHFFLQQPCRTFRANRCIALIPCECKPKGNNCIKRILWSLAQLYTLIYALRTAFCYCDQWLRPRTVCQCRDALLRSSVYRHKIDAVQDSMSGWWMRTLKQNSGSREHLSQHHVLMWMHYCRLCILNLCGCCMCYTHYCCHTQIYKWPNTSPLPYSPPCTNLVSDTAITVGLFTHSLTRTWHAHASPKWTGHQKITRRPCSYSNKLCHTTVKMRTSQIQAK